MPGSPDVFLSYSWLDNTRTEQVDKDTRQELGWVAFLEQRLAALVTMYRGRKTSVWRDATDMRGNFQLSTDVYSALDGSRLLVAVLSEGYLRSDWCPDEFDRFRARVRAESAPGEWKRRIFHLFRTPVNNGLMTAEIADAKHYEFFVRRSNAEMDHVPFEPNPLNDYKVHFDRLVTDLASDLAKELSPTGQTATIGTVYLAAPSADLQLRYGGLLAELKDRGYAVLPDACLPATGFAQAVHAQMERCDAVIFPIGAEESPLAGGTDRHETEFETALAICDSLTRPLLVWVPPRPELPVRSFARALAAGTTTNPGLEVRRSEFGNFKSDTLQWLKTLRARQLAAAAPVLAAAPCALIHDLCDLGDPALAQLQAALQHGREVPVRTPDFNGAPAELREMERDLLTHAAEVFIFCGASSEGWLDVKLATLKGNPGHAQRKLGVLLLDDGRDFKPKIAEKLQGCALLAGPQALNDPEILNTWLVQLP
ncbi:MAG: toll/interleukin-1 receptor domain-containing protein [Prosthecobacter sp.]|nr:toll/interleukin-1 receptor domain-containing protein [Prosthecobacter sp.]